ncbi:hypothetical protein LUU34_00279600 [Aix galericulata]|nr:hypothetical protein LUU34_00279600 [Aix galericulata]
MLGAVVPRRGRLFEYATSGPLFREHGGDSPRLLARRAVFQTGQSGCCYGSNWPMAERGSGKFKSRPARPGAVAACCGRQEVAGPAAEVRGRVGGAACGPEEPAVVACGGARRELLCHEGPRSADIGPAGISLPLELPGVLCRCLLSAKGVGMG